MEASVTVLRIAAADGRGTIYAPLATGGAGRLRPSGPTADRLARWLQGMEAPCLAAMRHAEDIPGWLAKAEAGMTPLSVCRAQPDALCWPNGRLSLRESLSSPSQRGFSCRSAYPCLVGETGPDPLDERAGAVSDVACGDLKSTAICMVF